MVDALAPMRGNLDQARAFKYRQMFLYGRAGDIKVARNLANGLITAGQNPKNAAPRRV